MGWSDDTARQTVEQWRDAITAIRNLRAESNVPKDAPIAPILVAQGTVAQRLIQGEAHLRSLSQAKSVTIAESVERPTDCAVAVLPEVEIILPLAGLIDRKAELARQRKVLTDLERQISGHQGKLGNEAFITRAPAAVVEQTRAKLAELEAQREAILKLLEPG
jgi:valyl-tRNA synthetase